MKPGSLVAAVQKQGCVWCGALLTHFSDCKTQSRAAKEDREEGCAAVRESQRVGACQLSREERDFFATARRPGGREVYT